LVEHLYLFDEQFNPGQLKTGKGTTGFQKPAQKRAPAARSAKFGMSALELRSLHGRSIGLAA